MPWKAILARHPKTFELAIVRFEQRYELRAISSELEFSYPAPSHLFPDDLPTWWTSLLAEKASPNQLPEALRAGWKARLEKSLQLPMNILTVWLANPCHSSVHDIYHLKEEHIQKVVQSGARVTIKGQVEEFNLVPRHLRFWSFSAWFTDSEQGAIFRRDLFKGGRSEIQIKSGVKAIIARNAERWETVHLPTSAVRKIAQTLGIHLTATSSDPVKERYSFLAEKSACPSD